MTAVDGHELGIAITLFTTPLPTPRQCNISTPSSQSQAKTHKGLAAVH
jgi:hypothetical protein